MKDFVLELMDQSEDIEFILSKDTAYDVALALLDDGRAFEEMEEFEVIEEINNSVAVIVSQMLTDEGYIYILENYLFDDGTAKGMDGADLVIIEDKIEDLVDRDRIYSRDVVIAVAEEEECECCVDFEDEKTNINSLTDSSVVVVELKRRFPIKTIERIRDSFEKAFPNNEVLIYNIEDLNLKVIN